MRGLAVVVTMALAGAATAQEVADMAPRDGFVVIPTEMSFDDLVAAAKDAARGRGFGIVTEAGPTGMAASRGIDIPGNRVIGVFNNDLAVRMLRESTAAMIEAPLRLYVTENADGTATLSYKTPEAVYAPYLGDAGDGLGGIVDEIESAFDAIGAAIRP